MRGELPLVAWALEPFLYTVPAPKTTRKVAEHSAVIRKVCEYPYVGHLALLESSFNTLVMRGR